MTCKIDLKKLQFNANLTAVQTNSLETLYEKVFNKAINSNMLDASSFYEEVSNVLSNTNLDTDDLSTDSSVETLLHMVKIITSNHAKFRGQSTHEAVTSVLKKMDPNFAEKVTTKDVTVQPEPVVVGTDDTKSNGGKAFINGEESVDIEITSNTDNNAELSLEQLSLNNVARPVGVRSMSKIIEHYLGEKLINKTDDLYDLFKTLVADSWLSTKVNTKVNEEFDSSDILKNIRKSALKIVDSYYKSISDATADGTFNRKSVEIRIVGDFDKLPLDVSPVMIDVSGVKMEMKVDVDRQNDITLSAYKSKANDNVIYVYSTNSETVVQNPSILSRLQGHGLTIESGTLQINVENQSNKALSKSFAEQNYNNTAIVSAYFAHIIANEQQAFVHSFVPELSTAFVEYRRAASAEPEDVGIKGSARMLTAAITTTRFLKEKTPVKTLKQAVTTSDVDYMKYLDRNGFLSLVSKDKKVLRYIDEYGSTKVGILLNTGKSKHLLIYDSDLGKWTLPIKKDGVITYTKAYDEFRYHIDDTISATQSSEIFEIFQLIQKLDSAKQGLLDYDFVDYTLQEATELLDSNNTKSALLFPDGAVTLEYAKSSDKFLSMKNIITNIYFFQNIPRTFSEAKAFLENSMKEDSEVGNIAKSLYYKFFHVGEYNITEYDPLTGKVVTNKHESLYNKFLKQNSRVAEEAVVSMLSHLASITIDNKVGLENDKLVISNIENTSDFNNFINSIDHHGMMTTDSNLKYVPDDNIKNHFSVIYSDGKIVIKYFKTRKSKYNDPTFTIEFVNNEFLKVSDSDAVENSMDDIIAILKLTPKIVDKSFLNIFRKTSNYDPIIVNDFFSSLVMTRLANTYNTTAKDYTYPELIEQLGAVDGLVKFTESGFFKRNSKVLAKTLAEYTKLNATTIIEGPTRNRIEGVMLRNEGKDKQNIIKNIKFGIKEKSASFLFQNNEFITGMFELLNNGITKLGIKTTDTGISNSKLSTKDQLAFQLSMFIQSSYGKMDTMLVQEDAMADRSAISMFKVALNKNFDSIPKLQNGDIDEHALMSRLLRTQRNSFSALENHIVFEWNKVFNSIIDGSINIALTKQQLTAIKNFIKDTRKVRELYNLLDDLNLNYDDLRHKSGLVENLTLVKGKDGKASIRSATVRLIEVMTSGTIEDDIKNAKDLFSGNDKYQNIETSQKMFYISMYKQAFDNYWRDAKVELSPEDIKMFKNALPEFLGNMSGTELYTEAKSRIKTLFFYNTALFDHALAQLGMGSLFQYKSKKDSKIDDVIEYVQKTLPESKDREKVFKNAIKMLQGVQLSNGKTVGTTSIDEIQSLKDGNYWGYVKTILSSKLDSFEKYQLLEFNDIFTQLNDTYIDRVKRNHGAGSSGHYMILAEDTKPGILMPKKTKYIQIENNKKNILTLHGKKVKMDIADGAMYVMPSYFYKHNKSLGGSFSLYSSTGGAIKVVNVSSDDNGVKQFFKLAGFNLFNYEMLNYVTPEHEAMMEFMMSKEKFVEHDPSYTGFYLDDNIITPGTEFMTSFKENSEDVIRELKKHGNYIGIVKVTYNDGNGLVEKEMSAKYLLNLVTSGKFDPTSIQDIQTTKRFVSGDVIKTKYDLYTYFGGNSTNMDMYNSITNKNEKEKFKRVYPFGFVEYQILDIMNNYASDDGKYLIRNAEVDLIVFTSSNKTGARNVNPPEVLYDRNSTKEVTTTTVSNDQLINILNAEHETDVSSNHNITEDQEETNITMMTQVMSAIVSEGKHIDKVTALNEAIAALSDNALKMLDIEIDRFEALKTSNAHDSAEHQFIVELLRKAIKTRKDPGTTEELLGETPEDAAQLSLDLKMILPMVRTSVNSEIKKRAIKLKFAGRSDVLSPIDGVIKHYTYNGVKLLRSSMNSKVDVNSLIKNEISSYGFEYFTDLPKLSDEKWTLSQIHSIDQVFTEHTNSDIIYKKNILADGTFKLIPVKISQFKKHLLLNNELVNDEINAGLYVSPWLDSDEKFGEDLQWVSYFKDGRNLMESEVFQSFFASGDLLENFASIQNMSLEIFEEYAKSKYSLKDGEHAFGIPSGLLARFLIERGVGFDENVDALKFVPFIGPNIKNAAIEYMISSDDPNALFNEFREWLSDYRHNPSLLTNKLKSNLKADLDTGLWKMKEAEFSMAPHHQVAFLLDYGEQPADIFGSTKEPDIARIMSITHTVNGEVKNLFSDEDRFVLETTNPTRISNVLLEKLNSHHSNSVKRFAKNLTDSILDVKDAEFLYNEVSKVGDEFVQSFSMGEINEIKTHIIYSKLLYALNTLNIDYAQEFIDLKKNRYATMHDTFATKIKKFKHDLYEYARKNGKFSDNQEDLIIQKSPLYLIDIYIKMGWDTESLLNKLSTHQAVVSNESNFSFIMSAAKMSKIELVKKLNQKIKQFDVFWATQMSNGFEKSLSFITARTPAQGPQFTALGKAISFIYSTKNAIYTPAELFVMNGGDVDIDKQNNITWHVSTHGTVVPFKVQSDGSLDINFYINKYRNELNKLEERLNARLDLDDIDRIRILTSKRKSDADKLNAITQNFILQTIINTLGNSDNALEMAVVTSLDKLYKIKEYLALFDFKSIDSQKLAFEFKNGKINANDEIVKLIEARKLAIPFSPSTKFIYEKLNMDGKSGIAIYASALKAYYAIYYATLTNEGVSKYNSNIKKKIKLDSGKVIGPNKDSSEALHSELMSESIKKDLKYTSVRDKTTKKPVRFIFKDRATGLYKEKLISGIANTEHKTPITFQEKLAKYNALHYEQAKKAYLDLAHAQDVFEEVRIVQSFLEQFKDYDDYNKNKQVWEDLSELLTAATDNAKELVLGIIGSNNDTSSIIATMLIVGIDLEQALDLLNTPENKEIIRLNEEQKGVTGSNKTETKSYFGSLLKSNINKYNSKINKEKIKEAILKTYGYAEDSKEFIDEFKKQVELAESYNPIKQLHTFSKGATELTTLARLLSINTSPPNKEIDIFNYMLLLKSVIRRFTKGKTEVNLDEFLHGNTEDRSSDFWKIIDAADESKEFFNIPYILFKNQHFFKYIQAIDKSNKILSGASFTIDILYNVFPKLLEDKFIYKTKLDYNQFSSVVSTIQELYISKYLKDKEVTTYLKNKQYNLYKLDDISKFLKDLPSYLEESQYFNSELKNNIALNHILIPNIVTDKSNGDTIRLLTGINSGALSQADITKVKSAMTVLKVKYPEIYKNLFLYSLLVDKGGLGSNSISELFTKEDFESLNSYLLELKESKELGKIFANIHNDLKQILLPVLTMQLSTREGDNNAKILKRRNSGFKDEVSEMDSSDYYDDFEQDQQDFTEYDEIETYVKKTRKAHIYDVSDVNSKKISGDWYIDDVFRSKTNSMLYKYVKGTALYMGNIVQFKTYVPLIKTIHSKIVGIQYSDVLFSSKDVGIKSIGYNYGYKINYTGYENARLIGYYQNGLYIVAIDTANGYSYMLVSEERLRELNKDSMVLRGNMFFPKNTNRFVDTRSTIYFDKNTHEYLESDNYEGISKILFNRNGTKQVFGESVLTKEDTVTNLITSKLSSKIKDYEIQDSLVDFVFAKMIGLFNYQEKNNSTEIDENELAKSINEHLDSGYDSGVLPRLIYKFKKELLDNKLKLYSFMRMSDENKFYYIIDVLKSSAPANINLSSLKYFDTSKIHTKLNRNIRTIANYSKSIKTLSEDIAYDADIEFLKEVSNGNANLTIKDYLNVLTKLPRYSMEKYMDIKKIGIFLNSENGIIKVYTSPKHINKGKHELGLVLPEQVRAKNLYKPLNKKVTKKLGLFLNRRFRNSTVKVMNEYEIKVLYPELDLKKNTNAIVKYDGTIILIENRATLSTFLHEMTHLYLAELKDSNEDLYFTIINKMKNSSEYNAIQRKYSNISGYTDIDILEEAFVFKLQNTMSEQFAYQMNSEDIDFVDMLTSDGITRFDKVTDSFENIFKEFFAIKEFNSKLELSDSLETVIYKIGVDMIFNKNSQLNSMTKSEKISLKKMLNKTNLTQSEAIAMLKQNEYIVKIC